MTLSKSDYMLFLRHPAWLWLKKYAKNKLPPIDATLQAKFDEGHVFEKYAEQLFSSVIRLGFNNYDEYLSLPSRTDKALRNGGKTFFQGRIEVDGITCIFDVLERVSQKEFDLFEIKATTKAKPEHDYDLAFQLKVLEASGLIIRSVFVIHANKEYVRHGAIDPIGITSKTDVTKEVRALSEQTTEQIHAAFSVLEQKTIPSISPRYINQLGIPGVHWFEEWLAIYKSLKPELDPYSIYSLSYPTPVQIGIFEDRGITLLKDVPEELALRPKQVAQIKTTKENKRMIDKENIEAFINHFEYPLYFFDYETCSALIPQFDGCSPYQDYPFQYSLHVQESPGSEVRHNEYLHNEQTNPMPGLLRQLRNDIGHKGTILTWNMSYEKGCNDRMAKLFPEYVTFLGSVNERINDLMIPFSLMWFFDKDFFGSASVKKVLPVLAPELSYTEMNIGEGLLARRLWTQTVLEGKNQDSREIIMSDLSKYCTLDTFAMVRILEELEKLFAKRSLV